MSVTTPFYLKTLPTSETLELSESEHVFARLGFVAQTSVQHEQCLEINTGMPEIGEGQSVEYWVSRTPVEYGQLGDIHYAYNDEILFGAICIDENDFSDIKTATEQAYQQLFDTLKLGYPYLTRIWNYFPRITDPIDHLNRYQHFCLGRQAILDQNGNFPYQPPAATCIGNEAEGLLIYFVAAKEAGLQIENPRQVSAFEYPEEHCPVSPAFSRATYKPWQQASHVYVSGTSSIVGHKTTFAGDYQEQLAETYRNLSALLQHGNEKYGLPITKPSELKQLKVYLKNAGYLAEAQSYLAQQLASQEPDVIYLRADVCRSNLAVEIEGLYA